MYVRYADSASTSPLGLPAGARLQAPVLQMQPLLLFPAVAAADVDPLTEASTGRRLLDAEDESPGDKKAIAMYLAIAVSMRSNCCSCKLQLL